MTWPRWEDPWVLALIAGTLAQLLKLLLYSVANRRLALRVLGATNGLPSFYSVGLGTLVTIVAQQMGPRSPEFATCMVFGGVILHDLIRVQGSVDKGGRMALLLAESMRPGEGNLWTEQLRPLLGDRGHRPLHVLVGLGLGVVFGLAAV